MKLHLLVKLAPTQEQHSALLQTMERFNEACNYVSRLAFDNHTASQVKLHHLAYRYLREHYGLSSQMAVRVVGKVIEPYRGDKTKLCYFAPHSAMVYDARILSFKGLDAVSILTLRGRLIIPIRIGEYQKARVNTVVKETDLLLRNNIFYLAVIVDAPEPTPDDPIGALGVDLGITNLAVDSDGEMHSGETVDKIRKRLDVIKSSLQHKGTKSARRHLKRIAHKEARFRRSVNHLISKRLVSKAKDTHRLIAIEDLGGINKAVTVRKSQRRRHNSWAFYQLRFFITYKAKIAGVVVQLVDPRHTSQTCPKCGYISRSNRHSQSFICQSCGFASNADLVGATNIAHRATVNWPFVSPPCTQEGRSKLLLSACSS